MINNKLYNDIKSYCEINNINDIESEVNNMLQIGFNIIRYGISPFPPKDTKVEEKPKKGRKPKPKIEEPIINNTINKIEQITVEEPQNVIKKTRIIKN